MIEPLKEAPVALTDGERMLLFAMTVLTAITRWLGLSKTMWDWDESLFMLGLRHYDVSQHHPHPPGFPLFVGSAKLFTLAGFGDFHALQAVNFVAAVSIVPAMFLLGRELRASTGVALASAMLLAFFPNVWFYGGTGFSDVPSMVLVMLAVALLLRGCRDPRWFLAGAALTGIAAGFRPQNLVIAFLPSLLAAWFQWKRNRMVPIGGLLIVLTIVGLSYGCAVYLTGGWDIYRAAVKMHQEYITRFDSFRSPGRPPLLHLFDDFFIRPYRAPVINTIVTILALGSVVSLLRRRLSVWLALGSFGPFCILAWLLLDRFSVSRFSIGYAPLLALLAADGVEVLTGARWRIGAAATAVATLVMVVWTWPAIREVQQHDSPPVVAARWIRSNANPRTTMLYVHEGMIPFAQALLPEYPQRFLMDETPPTSWVAARTGLFVKEEVSTSKNAHLFVRERGRLFDIARQRYFEVAVTPMSAVVDFADGWYEEESSGTSGWRWMGHRSRALLPPFAGHARLQMRLYVPLDALPAPPNVTVSLNGTVVERFRATSSNLEKSYDVEGRGGAPNELLLETDRVVNPAAERLREDSRDLGLRLESIEWMKRP